MRWGVSGICSILKQAAFVLAFILTFTGCNAEILGGAMLGGETINRNLSTKEVFFDEETRSLAVAVEKGDLKEITKIVERGGNVNAVGRNDLPILFWGFNNIDSYSKLLELGANPNIEFMDTTIIHMAASHKNSKFLALALRYGGDPNIVSGPLKETPLFDTIQISGSSLLENMRTLLNAGANINATTQGEYFGFPAGGTTPVMRAVDLHRFDIAYELLERGADATLKDDNGNDLANLIEKIPVTFIQGSNTDIWLKKVQHLMQN